MTQGSASSQNGHLITSEELDAALGQSYRQYLVGDLSQEQLIDHWRHAGLEIGVSRYDTFRADTPHSHDESLECLLVLDGEYVVRFLDEDHETVLRTGDFFAIPAGRAYASKTAGARVLFVKSPGGHDKRDAPVNAALRAWLDAPPRVPEGKGPRSDLGDVLTAYGHHLAEWQHRDEQWLTISFRWFSAALLVSLLPHLESYFSLETGLSPFLFTIAGIGLTVYFLVVSRSYGERLTASGNTMAKVGALLPVELRRERIRADAPRWTRQRIATWTPWVMATFLLTVNAISAVALLAR